MDLHNVGALTPFDINNALDLADYCDRLDQDDDTVCIGQWIDDARKQGKHLYVSPGTYLYSDGKAIFKGFHLQCAGPTRAVFKAINHANDLFVLAPTWASESDAPWQDISIENCGFDLNGSTAQFASVISLVGGTAPLQHVTVRGNIVYDSAQPGQMYTTRDRQRQYIVVLNAEDVLVENNHLSGGGRIKVGRPGRRIVIRHNTLYNINDNGITVVDQGSGISSDILIEHNTITNPINSGIFFGTDGQWAGTAALQLYDVTIRANIIAGNFLISCITGILPNHVARIYIGENTCHKTGPTPTGVFVAGIGLSRNQTSTQYATDITVHDNTIVSDVYNAYNNLAGIFVTDYFANLCLLSNRIYATATAIHFRSNMPWAQAADNFLDGGRLRIGPHVAVDQSGKTAGCYAGDPVSNW
jgi:hypothetical protein